MQKPFGDAAGCSIPAQPAAVEGGALLATTSLDQSQTLALVAVLQAVDIIE